MLYRIFELELKRLSRHLKKHDPNGKYALIVDNVASHRSLINYANLDLVALVPNTTAYLQPLDTMVFAILKNQYRSWLGKQLLTKNSICEGEALSKVSEIFKDIGQNAMDYAFKLTGIPKFKHLKAELAGLNEIEKEEYLAERFAELNIRDGENNVNAKKVETERRQKEN